VDNIDFEQPLYINDVPQVKQPEQLDNCQSFTGINPASNAGVGWQLHFGKLFRPRGDIRDAQLQATEKLYEVYQSPDGSEHQFYTKLHEDDTEDSPDAPNLYYTRDGSYLRMWKNPVQPIAESYGPTKPYTYIIEFPNGEKHYFQRLTVRDGSTLNGTPATLPYYEDKIVRIEDRFGNFITIDYLDDPVADSDSLRDNQWVVKDSVGRTHTVNFLKNGYMDLISSIELDNSFAPNKKSVYKFAYSETDTDIAVPHALKEFGIPGYNQNNDKMFLPYLTSLTLPDESSYSMPLNTSYNPLIQNITAQAPGALRRITLPTGGIIEWDYTTTETNATYGYFFAPGSSGRQSARLSPGVRRRRLIGHNATGGEVVLGEWKYDPHFGPWQPGCQFTSLDGQCGPYHIVNKVTAPTKDYTLYYFSIYPQSNNRDPKRTPTQAHIADYSLPFTKDTTDIHFAPIPDSLGGKLFLSTESYAANGRLQRSSYVRYEGDKYVFSDGFSEGIEYNPRMEATRTNYYYPCDTPTCTAPTLDKPDAYTEVQYSGFDGLGHYRNENLFGNFGYGDRRYNVTIYNQNRGTYRIDASTNERDLSVGTFYTPFPEGQPWVLDTYSMKISSDFVNQRSTTYFNFNEKGQLLAKRIRRDFETPSTAYNLSPKDVLVNYSYDLTNGNLQVETYFGGEKRAGLTTAASTPTLADSGSEYKITYGYQCQRPDGTTGTTSTVANKSYRTSGTDVSFKSVDNTVDCSTGLVKTSADPAGITTTYRYDAMARLTAVLHQQGSYDEIKYEPHGSSSNATGLSKVSVTRRPNGSFSGSTLSEEVYVYDELGRLNTERKRLPDGSFQARTTNYNVMGWVTDVTEWIPSTAAGAGRKTVYSDFDPYGRPGRIELPDFISGNGHVIFLKYKGDRVIERTVRTGYLINDSRVVTERDAITTEIYDRQGRLYQLIEPSGSSGQNTTWTYQYNINNQLGSVSSTEPGTGISQGRSFAYDNLGNLTAESHPERDWAQYSEYDTMGNVGTVYDGAHWLTYAYDSYGRVKQISELDGSTPGGRPIKDYTYDTAVGRGTGKVATAVRHNYVTNPYPNNVANAGNGATVVASSTNTSGGFSPQNVIDGNRSSYQWTVNGGWNDGTQDSWPDWIEVRFAGLKNVRELNIFTLPDNYLTHIEPTPSDTFRTYGVVDFQVQYMNSSGSWVDVPGGNIVGNNKVWRRISLSTPIAASRIRVNVTKALYAWTRITEIEAIEATPQSQAIIDVPVKEEYSYQGTDGLLSQQTTQMVSYSFNQSFAYDGLGNLTSQTYPQCTNSNCAAPTGASSQARPLTVHYNYTQGLLTSVGSGTTTTNNNYASSIAYNSNGTVAKIVHGNNIEDNYAEDPNSMARTRSIDIKRTVDGSSIWSSGNYAYDGAGNITKIGNDWYLYDKVSRVVEGSVISSGMKKRYNYDAFGNILSVNTYSGVTTPTNGITPPDTYNSGTNSAKNRFSLYYDGAGNTLGLLPATTGQQPTIYYTYDALNMIKFAPSLTYLYGPDDERIWTLDWRDQSNITETITLRGLNNEVLREYQVRPGDGPGHWQWAKDYIYANGKLLASEAPSPTGLRHYHLDHLGTPRVITDGAGTPLYGSPYYYFPFGDEAGIEPPSNERLRFTGHERDLNDPFKLDYMHARFYLRAGNSVGKFMSVDPGKDWDPKQPQSWNMYSYVRNNPIKALDPTGRAIALAGNTVQALRALRSMVPPDYRNFIQAKSTIVPGVLAIDAAALNKVQNKSSGNFEMIRTIANSTKVVTISVQSIYQDERGRDKWLGRDTIPGITVPRGEGLFKIYTYSGLSDYEKTRVLGHELVHALFAITGKEWEHNYVLIFRDGKLYNDDLNKDLVKAQKDTENESSSYKTRQGMSNGAR
jgi:RHS repeat-associated protein